MNDLKRPDLGDLVARLTADDLDRRERGRLLGGVVKVLGTGARAATLSGRRLADLLIDDVAPRLPVRDLLTLRGHHQGLSGDDLASALIRNASVVTAGIGAAAGALAAVELAAPPVLLAAPVQLAAETLAVVAVELKLVAELHVVYGKSPTGTRRQLAIAYLSSWAGKRGLDTTTGGPSLSDVLSTAARQQVRQRVVRRFRRNLTSLAPFLAGAVAGAELNRRETRRLGEAVQRDLRVRR
ncbi:MAG: hypothetical protein JWP14_843 [Frankiales bacterium]|nr:hypothetical protein [Frankiales bacterium]